MRKNQLGQLGESLAQAYLVQKGYVIVASNWRFQRLGELDIVAYLQSTRQLCFVEVKTRRSARYGTAVESITEKKQRNIQQLAEIFLAQTELSVPVEEISFDVITVQADPLHEYETQVQHLINAF